MKISKKYKIFLILLFIVLALIFYVLRPIGNNELTKKELIGEKYCFELSSSLESRCGLLGGEIRSELIALGVGPVYKIGCFPKGETRDSGKECLGDSYCSKDSVVRHSDMVKAYCKKYYKVCEGICIDPEWGILGVVEGHLSIPSRCSEFKKPFFASKKTIMGNDGLICGKKSMSFPYDSNIFIK